MKNHSIILSIILSAPILAIPLKKNGIGRIIGGTGATSGQFPFSVALEIRKADGLYFCGATIIDQQWILTAAQCVDSATQFTMYLGSNHLTEPDINRETLTSSEYYAPKSFNPETLANDVALIATRLPITFTDYIQPVKLPDHDFPDTVSGTAIGWGWTSDDAVAYSETLNFVTLAVVSNQECMNVYGEAITTSTLCVEGNYNEGTCIGDSGGPFLLKLAGDRGFWQIGVASFLSSYGCESPHPSGYTRTYPYVDWIHSITTDSRK